MACPCQPGWRSAGKVHNLIKVKKNSKYKTCIFLLRNYTCYLRYNIYKNAFQILFTTYISMRAVHYTVYTFMYSSRVLYSIQFLRPVNLVRLLYTVQCTVYSAQCILYSYSLLLSFLPLHCPAVRL